MRRSAAICLSGELPFVIAQINRREWLRGRRSPYTTNNAPINFKINRVTSRPYSHIRVCPTERNSRIHLPYRQVISSFASATLCLDLIRGPCPEKREFNLAKSKCIRRRGCAITEMIVTWSVRGDFKIEKIIGKKNNNNARYKSHF